MIMHTIGQGGMGAVYQAKDLRHDTICAVKEMSLSSVPVNEHAQAIQNFLAEATILSRLDHPNLPTFTDFFTEGSRHFLVMEYIEGETLEALLDHKGHPFSEHQVLAWARQLCDVLEYLHNQQPPVIFRDMKPGNIMLRHDGRIKLVDFGIARLYRRSGLHDTQMLGTPGFAPPEQYGSSQTDARSDMYSLAMTLFQLLTNTLVEQGFGLQDVRSINPAISPAVAHALERATDPELENRYENIAAFRRALLGVGNFIFEEGNLATTPEELAELCADYPEEAADYLISGEIEDWLHEIGATDLARVTKRIRVTTGDPQVGVEKFVQVVLETTLQTGRTGTVIGSRSNGYRISRPPSTVIVRPDTLDFGAIHPGISAPMLLYISGHKGASVHGTISSGDPWIITDMQFFDGMSTLVRIRVDSTDLQVVGKQTGPISTHYKGAIVVRPANEASEYTIPVEVDVLGTQASSGEQVAVSDSDDFASMQVSLRQRLWLKRGRTFAAAFMLASFSYTFLAYLPPLAHTPALPPSQWFIAVLLGMVPLATLGALLVNTRMPDILNRFCTGLSVSLSALGLGELLWQVLLRINVPPLQLCIMLLLIAVGAAIGTTPAVSERIIEKGIWAMQHMRLLIIAAAVLVGSALGFALTVGLIFSFFTPLSIVLGIGVAVTLLMRLDRLIKYPSGAP